MKTKFHQFLQRKCNVQTMGFPREWSILLNHTSHFVLGSINLSFLSIIMLFFIKDSLYFISIHWVPSLILLKINQPKLDCTKGSYQFWVIWVENSIHLDNLKRKLDLFIGYQNFGIERSNCWFFEFHLEFYWSFVPSLQWTSYFSQDIRQYKIILQN